jgi:DNA-binding HxlR family transcriptional regulator
MIFCKDGLSHYTFARALQKYSAILYDRNAMEVNQKNVCPVSIRAVNDALELLGGKWKLPIIMALFTGGKQRFMELERNVVGITPKMLSKELQDLEVNQLVVRRVFNTKPITVEYELTAYCEQLKPVLDALGHWGSQHRALLMKNE